jgi:hypothetical protein
MIQINASSGQPYDPYAVAVDYCLLGNKDQALTWLDRAYKVRSSSLIFLKADPQLAAMHSDPRYTDLVRRMGLPQ